MTESSIAKSKKICQAEGCNRKHCARGYCDTHYRQFILHGTTKEIVAHNSGPCTVNGCDSKSIARGYCPKHYGRIRQGIGFSGQDQCSIEQCGSPAIANGLCSRHNYQMWSTGYIYGNPSFGTGQPNEFIRGPKICSIVLRDAYGFYVGEAIIDSEDLLKVCDKKWCSHGDYVSSGGTLLHRSILGLNNDSLQVDHINHNPRDNRKSNLRICTGSQNLGNMKVPSNNTSGYKGVSYHKRDEIWMARIRKEGCVFYLGSFANKIDAARAYDKAALECFGEFACLNGV